MGFSTRQIHVGVTPDLEDATDLVDALDQALAQV